MPGETKEKEEVKVDGWFGKKRTTNPLKKETSNLLYEEGRTQEDPSTPPID